MNNQSEFKLRPLAVSISEDDIYAAMKEIPGYLDITPGDFKELYVHAYQHAIGKITGSITAEQIMNREVVCFEPSTPLTQAARIMAENNFSGAPVIDYADKVVGVISKKDFIYCIAGKGTRSFLNIILKFLECKECVAQTIEGKKVYDIMSSPAITT